MTGRGRTEVGLGRGRGYIFVFCRFSKVFVNLVASFGLNEFCLFEVFCVGLRWLGFYILIRSFSDGVVVGRVWF